MDDCREEQISLLPQNKLRTILIGIPARAKTLNRDMGLVTLNSFIDFYFSNHLCAFSQCDIMDCPTCFVSPCLTNRFYF